MLQLPRRSVTRFFIPLIDVLTLLFATFLLLPVLKATAETEKAPKASSTIVGDEAAELQRRLVVRILSIEKVKRGNGIERYELVYRKQYRVEPVPVVDAAGAHEVIATDKKDLAPGEQLYYLVLLPRDDPESLYPLESDVKNYREWFQSVALGFEDLHTGKVHKEQKSKP
jgi:hypothetical protein